MIQIVFVLAVITKIYMNHKPKVMKTYYYALVNKNGNLITTDCKVPIYWNEKIAIQEAIKFEAKIRRIKIADLIASVEPKYES